MNTSLQDAKGMEDVIAMGRAVMLMEPMAADFNELLMASPKRRVMMVAEAFNKASAFNDTLKGMIDSKNVMVSLFNEGRRRGSGEVTVPAAFLSDLVASVTVRETAHV